MFLAWKEMIHSKSRYIMIVLVLTLLAYLVFFLTGLAFGLGEANRSAIDLWQADQIILSSSANGRLNASLIQDEWIEDLSKNHLEGISLLQLVAKTKEKTEAEEDQKLSLSLLATDEDGLAQPNLIEGEKITEPFQVIGTSTLKDVYGFEIGDQIQLIGKDQKLELVGFTGDQMLSVTPLLYSNLETSQELKGKMTEDAKYSALLVRDHDLLKELANDENLQVFTIADFIEKLPGYQAQNLTFIMIIVFLIIIAAIVVGIFIYVLTVQKVKIFGVMKAQGISSFFIGSSVVLQTLIMAVIGTLTGLILTVLTAIYLPAKVPFAFSWQLITITMVLMIIFAVVGGLLSVKQIVKIDPSQAIA
ncbi:ABC transporter permease [Facklamia miroungae]|uniref:Putative hemin transport system permease protein HrtB n=1 Tax=Facklamia miroungae TaxID=120956 RepID=A0A1G7TLW6_9LACT|nr:ABC transporter permease [Facklamia miroungae]NKZ29779.1 ABC transporter permease [Facklamia miroungae]SDG36326.1 putative ABC transport system permease protein [Facklamia miroungae]